MKSRRNVLCFIILPVVFFFLSTQPLGAKERGLLVKARLEKASGKTVGAYRALVIGINDYKDPEIPDLKTAENDARAVSGVLKESYGFSDVSLLLGDEATGTKVEKELRRLVTRSKENDSVLVYYAGHGELDDITGSGWWVPWNANAGDPFTYIDNAVIQRYIKAIPARHVLIVADSCFSGTLFGEAPAPFQR